MSIIYLNEYYMLEITSLFKIDDALCAVDCVSRDRQVHCYFLWDCHGFYLCGPVWIPVSVFLGFLFLTAAVKAVSVTPLYTKKIEKKKEKNWRESA